MQTITVIKKNIEGQETWRYRGELLSKHNNRIILEAFFDMEDTQYQGMPFQQGDRFVETYFTDRWYNIFELHSVEDDSLRGWYCNIAHPAILDGDVLSYIDLALDLLVFPDGRLLILDREEFDELPLEDHIRDQAECALQELLDKFQSIS